MFLTEKLLGYLPGIEPTLSTCEEYFVLVSKLVAEQTTQYVHLLDKLCQMIKQHPTVEVTNFPRNFPYKNTRHEEK